MDIDEGFAHAVAREIARQRVGVAWLAGASGIPVRTLRRYLKAERDVKLKHVCSISRALGVRCSEMVARADLLVEH